jgi:hypothetical protein
MPDALFRFFEVIADELSNEPSRVLTRFSLQINDDQAPLFDDLKRQLRASTTEAAIDTAVTALTKHFEERGSTLPFSYDVADGRFSAVDEEYLKFVREMSGLRSMGKRSRDFECRVASRLTNRLLGSIHRVGHPRDVKKKQVDFNTHLKGLGFERPVLLGKDKDGGFDILVALSLGHTPHKPLLSIQCKNGEFDFKTAHHSLGVGNSSLSHHAGLLPQVHLPCVLFNDYILTDLLGAKPLGFVPLGLSDLSSAKNASELSLI